MQQILVHRPFHSDYERVFPLTIGKTFLVPHRVNGHLTSPTHHLAESHLVIPVEFGQVTHDGSQELRFSENIQRDRTRHHYDNINIVFCLFHPTTF